VRTRHKRVVDVELLPKDTNKIFLPMDHDMSQL